MEREPSQEVAMNTVWKNRKTHDYTSRYWGHDFTHNGPEPDGSLKITGWGLGISKKDYLILPIPGHPGESTRYTVDSIEYKSDPRDMWSAVCSFAPRKG